MLTYGSYIGGNQTYSGEWTHTVRASAMLDDVIGSIRTKRDLDRGRLPADRAPESVIGRCAVGDHHDVEAALAAASAAVRTWAATPLRHRLRFVAELHRLTREKHDDIVEMLVAEGHPRALARWEVSGILVNTREDTRDFLATQLEQHIDAGERRFTLRRVADGVVCLNPPQNATLANAMLGAWALAAGNALVVRAPRSAPLGVLHAMHELVVPALEHAGAPPEVLSVVCSDAPQTLQQWLNSPLVDDIMYFGGSEQGVAFGAECVRHGKKPVLELAGNDTCVVWRDADLDLAAAALAEAFYGSGQICMVPNCAVVHPDVADELLHKLGELARRIRPGMPEEPDVLLSPVRRTDAFQEVLGEALDRGARLVCGGRRLDVDGTPNEVSGMFLEPTVIRVDGLKSARDLRAVREETFFPLLPVVVPDASDADLLEQVVEFTDANQYGLRNSLWARDPEVVRAFVAGVRSGGLLKVNDSHIGFLPVLPTHGGTGLTGGPGGEANYPALRTSHLQGVSVATGIDPAGAVFAGTDERGTL
ncbi:Acyl-CoA reductase [Streptomyces sp. 1222.5]|uniref:aldehyde dehydrogenase family protein n=1 Tax=unclassified Streptomyces TaxID=2593676 RepID=UPI00089A3DDB|nr:MULTISPECIES: aldehyde dehydrogenase family protein [unclassified Streptomyces]PKW11911.1 acyl-CoA reductase-like NAD-dependent aldehyde dehydrogenase [Streptomyces sp. 5112.2]SEB67042.1 Acyl-CoA reductase [Streptomyces sp. 1222.5]